LLEVATATPPPITTTRPRLTLAVLAQVQVALVDVLLGQVRQQRAHRVLVARLCRDVERAAAGHVGDDGELWGWGGGGGLGLGWVGWGGVGLGGLGLGVGAWVDMDLSGMMELKPTALTSTYKTIHKTIHSTP